LAAQGRLRLRGADPPGDRRRLPSIYHAVPAAAAPLRELDPTVDFTADVLARLNDNPLYHALGIRVDHCHDGNARSTLSPTANACWPSPASPHGGVLFTVVDTTMAWAAMSLAGAGESVTTVDCSIQYAAPAAHGPFACDAESMRKTGRTVFVRARIVDGRGGIVALGQGTFRIIRDQSA
jgi:uncharacterized protein (TIGR00369 family)